MDRRNFLKSSVQTLSAAAILRGQNTNAGTHRLPATESQYKHTKDYVEDVPVPEYRWASPQAYEAFRDMKVGVRVHWVSIPSRVNRTSRGHISPCLSRSATGTTSYTKPGTR